MHIVVVTETYPPEVNGVALTVQGLVTQMAAAGHDLDLYRPRQPGLAARPPCGRIRETLLPCARLPRYPELRFGLPAGALLRRRFRERRPDVIYVATEGPLGWSAVAAARKLGIPVATGFHTRFDAYAGAYGLHLLEPVVRWWLRRLHNAAGATIVPTTELRAWLEHQGFRRVKVLGRGVDTALFSPAQRDPQLRASWGLGEDGLAVIQVGRMAAEKNLPLAIEAFRHIRIRQPGSRLILVGDGPLLPQLRRAHPDILFAGVRHGVELARYFASADLFLFPSLTETFGNVTLEAMASGVPTVAFDYGAAHEHLRDGFHGRILPRGDERGFINAAATLASDAPARRAMAAAARVAALRLRPEEVTRQFVGLLARVPAMVPA
ncbi:MAG: glycosyltransferase family 1 protein [Gammaproteobacteria bacterium]|nr:MAG: glycosyltransferase family 1 protein [Gammaproteobacteria bacterium]